MKMIATLGFAAARYLGPRAFKAVAAGLSGAAGTAAVVVTQACDIDAALGPYIGTAGVALVSYLITYWTPNKK